MKSIRMLLIIVLAYNIGPSLTVGPEQNFFTDGSYLDLTYKGNRKPDKDEVKVAMCDAQSSTNICASIKDNEAVIIHRAGKDRVNVSYSRLKPPTSEGTSQGVSTPRGQWRKEDIKVFEHIRDRYVHGKKDSRITISEPLQNPYKKQEPQLFDIPFNERNPLQITTPRSQKRGNRKLISSEESGEASTSSSRPSTPSTRASTPLIQASKPLIQASSPSIGATSRSLSLKSNKSDDIMKQGTEYLKGDINTDKNLEKNIENPRTSTSSQISITEQFKKLPRMLRRKSKKNDRQ